MEIKHLIPKENPTAKDINRFLFILLEKKPSNSSNVYNLPFIMLGPCEFEVSIQLTHGYRLSPVGCK